jgi:hypothetical protein
MRAHPIDQQTDHRPPVSSPAATESVIAMTTVNTTDTDAVPAHNGAHTAAGDAHTTPVRAHDDAHTPADDAHTEGGRATDDAHGQAGDAHGDAHTETGSAPDDATGDAYAPERPDADARMGASAAEGETNHADAHTETGDASGDASGGEMTRTRRARTRRDDAHMRAALADRKSRAEQIRFACEHLGTPTVADVQALLAGFGDVPTRQYTSRIVNEWRRANGLDSTGELPALTPDVLAGLDAPQEAAEMAPTQPQEASVPADPVSLPDAAVDAATADLAARVASARGRLPLQSDPALFEALSEEELRKERELAEWIRETDRQIRRSEQETKLAIAKRDQKTANVLATDASKDARWHRRALAARERLTSEAARTAQLYRRAEWSSRALIAVVVLGMVWSGVNVQHNLVPSGDMSDPLYWLSYGIEAMISVPIIVIMVAATTAARWGRKVQRAGVAAVELALLALTIGLNAGPHVRSDLATAAEYAIAPVMVGVVIWVHSWVSQHYASLIEGADDQKESTR